MRRRFVCFAMATLAAWSAPALPQDVVSDTPLLVVHRARQFGHGTFPRRTPWQGLYCRGLACDVRPAEVQITTTTAIDISEATIPLDVLNVGDEPLALFPNGRWKVGHIETWYVAGSPAVPSGQVRQLKQRGQWQMPWGARPLTLSWVRTPENRFRYHVSDGTTTQFLFATDQESHYGGDTTPVVHWVGDLDGDGAADILLDLPDDNCGYDERLYLSSRAAPGKLLGKAGQLVGGEAACGC